MINLTPHSIEHPLEVSEEEYDQFVKKSANGWSHSESHLEFLCAKPVIFGVPHFQGPLNEICDSYGIKRSFQHNLVSIDGNAKEAVFKQSDKDGNSKEVTKKKLSNWE